MRSRPEQPRILSFVLRGQNGEAGREIRAPGSLLPRRSSRRVPPPHPATRQSASKTRWPADCPSGTVFMATSTWFSAHAHKIAQDGVPRLDIPRRGRSRSRRRARRVPRSSAAPHDVRREMPAAYASSDAQGEPQLHGRRAQSPRTPASQEIRRSDAATAPGLRRPGRRHGQHAGISNDFIGELEHIRDPAQQRASSVTTSLLDGRLQSLRMAVAADGQSLTAQLQQPHERHGPHRAGNS